MTNNRGIYAKGFVFAAKSKSFFYRNLSANLGTITVNTNNYETTNKIVSFQK